VASAAPHLILLEASKVRHYHSTLVDGLIRGYVAAGLERRFGRVTLRADQSFFANLSEESRAHARYEPISVMDQDRGRRALKSLHEAWLVARSLRRLRPNEVLLVTTIYPSAMPFVEIVKWFMARRKLVVLQHSELEGAFEPARVGSYPWFNLLWHRLRRLGSTIGIAVLDRFIADGVRDRYRRSVRPDRLFVIPLPMTRNAGAARADDPSRRPRCCFVGYVTGPKGFDRFQALADALPQMDFRIVGGGQDRDARSDEAVALTAPDAFSDALAACDFAIFPYVSGYSASLSAAATDAVASGLHLITSDRPCFRALAEAFGPQTVTICTEPDQMRALLSDAGWVRARMSERDQRLARIDTSHYSLPSVGRALEQMLDSLVVPAADSQPELSPAGSPALLHERHVP
jgi:hypothetical protein